MTQSMSQTQSPKPLESRLSSIDSCIFQLRTWKPFNPNNNSSSSSSLHNKRPCLSDRKTSSFSIDISKLSLDDDTTTTITTSSKPFRTATSYRLIARKRRRRPGGSRSVSGRSSDRSGTRRCCSVGASAAHGTCSDFPVAMGTDSSGELFGEANWASDVSEARRERDNGGGGGGGSGGGGSGEKEGGGGGGGGLGFGGVSGVVGCSDGNGNGNESGYGSEPGYRGDAEFGYGDEFDEEEDDPRLRLLFWGEQIGAVDSKMEMVGENTLLDQKSHHRCRRRKHDCRMVDALR